MESKIITNTLNEISKALEERVQFLVVKFEGLNSELVTLEVNDLGNIKDPESMNKLNEMIEIFREFKCIEKLVRYKYPQYNTIFDKLFEIEEERTHGKFFSFLRCIPSSSKRKYTKKPAVALTYQQTIGDEAKVFDKAASTNEEDDRFFKYKSNVIETI